MKNINNKLNNLSLKNKILLFLFLFLIIGSLVYLILINGDYKVEYSKLGEYCVEYYDNYELVSEKCPDRFKNNAERQHPGDNEWQYPIKNLNVSNIN